MLKGLLGGAAVGALVILTAVLAFGPEPTPSPVKPHPLTPPIILGNTFGGTSAADTDLPSADTVSSPRVVGKWNPIITADSTGPALMFDPESYLMVALTKEPNATTLDELSTMADAHQMELFYRDKAGTIHPLRDALATLKVPPVTVAGLPLTLPDLLDSLAGLDPGSVSLLGYVGDDGLVKALTEADLKADLKADLPRHDREKLRARFEQSGNECSVDFYDRPDPGVLTAYVSPVDRVAIDCDVHER